MANSDPKIEPSEHLANQEPAGAPPVPDHLKPTDSPTNNGPDQELPVVDHTSKADRQSGVSPTKQRGKFTAALAAWWHNPKARWGTIIGLTLLLLIVFSWPKSRYAVLNTVGVRSSAHVTIVDQTTKQPLKNVQVTLAGQTQKTNVDGIAAFTGLHLGPTTLSVSRRAFASTESRVTIGWGSNPLDTVALQPTGARYSFYVTDFASGKGMAKVEASSDDADAVSDATGHLVLTIDATDSNIVPVTFKTYGYREDTLQLNLDDKNEHRVVMVPGRKHVFISKRTGKYNTYSAYADGSGETLLLAGTGNERDDLALVPHPSADEVALVSTRNNLRNRDGFLMTTLTLLNSKTGQALDLVQSEKIQVNGWIGNRLIYTQVAAGASASDPNRQQLISYDFTTGSQVQLASSNYFNSILVAGDTVYYAPSDAFQTNPVGFYKIRADGSARIKILDAVVWSLFRNPYDTLYLNVGQDWYSYKLGEATATKLKGPPANQQNRLYVDNEQHQQSLWVDSRDGKGVLINTTIASGQETSLQTKSGLIYPVSWLSNDYVVYRIHTDQETADYVLSLAGGPPHKIVDVTNTAGLAQWYYYGN